MRKWFILPLSLAAAGVFFLPFWFSWVWLSILSLIFLLLQPDKMIPAIKSLFFLLLFTFPLAVVKLLTVHEGMVTRFSLLTLYSGGWESAISVLGRVLVLGMTSFMVFRWLVPLNHIPESWKRGKFFRILLLSITVYQYLLANFFPWWRKERKKGEGWAEWVDKMYVKGRNIHAGE